MRKIKGAQGVVIKSRKLLLTIVVITTILILVPKKLREELKTGRPFTSREEEVFLNVLRTADALTRNFAEVLKPASLTPAQYNALRILRGARPEGLACKDISERMVARDPDITRLLDRIERRGLITRSRESRDRRVITTRITEEGLRVLATLDAAVEGMHREMLGHMGEKRLEALSEMLELARERRA